MMRAAAAILVAVLGAFPLSVLFAPPITWLAVAALVVGGTGVVLLSMPLVTAGASVALIAYTAPLVMAEAAVGLLAALPIAPTPASLVALPAVCKTPLSRAGSSLRSSVNGWSSPPSA